MKMADIYERADAWYIQSSSRAITGLWVGTPPTVRIGRHEPRQRRYEAAFQALSESRQGVPLPKPEDNLVAEILHMANVKSWSAFMRSAKCISLELENGRLSIVPYCKQGSKGALGSIPEKVIELAADASPEEVGAAMEEAFTRCQ